LLSRDTVSAGYPAGLFVYLCFSQFARAWLSSKSVNAATERRRRK